MNFPPAYIIGMPEGDSQRYSVLHRESEQTVSIVSPSCTRDEAVTMVTALNARFYPVGWADVIDAFHRLGISPAEPEHRAVNAHWLRHQLTELLVTMQQDSVPDPMTSTWQMGADFTRTSTADKYAKELQRILEGQKTP